MIHQKKVSMGAFLKKGEDFKDEDIVVIAGQAKETDGQYGKQQIILIKTKAGKEGNINLNQTSINNLIEVYGEDDLQWIGKEAKVWLLKDFKDGKMILKMYLSHPNAEMTEKGFILTIQEKSNAKSKPKKLIEESLPVAEDDIDVSEIPFG